MRFAFSLLFLCLLAPLAGAQPLSLDTDRLARIEPALQEEVDAGVRAGFVVAVGFKDQSRYLATVGQADMARDRAMTADTRFRIASMTKPITTAGILILVEQGKLRLNDPVADYIPAFADLKVAKSPMKGDDGRFETQALARPITIHDLLTHQAGLGYLFDGRSDLGKQLIADSLYRGEGDLAARIERLVQHPLYHQPGTRWFYSYATDVAGRVIEIVSGQTLEAFLDGEIFTPLGMDDTEFLVDESDLAGVATLYTADEEGRLMPFGAGENGLGPNPNKSGAGWMSGGGGLISTAPDYLRFCLMLLNGGALDGKRVLSPATVQLMVTDQVAEPALPADWIGLGFGLGGQIVNQPGLAGQMAAPGDWRWGGFYETSFFISPATGLAVVVMTQREPGPTMPESRAADTVRAIAYGALKD